jgi:hypothetical protein
MLSCFAQKWQAKKRADASQCTDPMEVPMILVGTSRDNVKGYVNWSLSLLRRKKLPRERRLKP